MYTSNYGLLDLRIAISEYLKDRHGLTYSADKQVLVTVGISQALDLAMRAILDPGDEVIIPEPTYVSYVPCVILAGGVPVTVPTHMDNSFHVRPSDIESHITRKTKAILLGYPNNPTGAVMPRNDLEKIARIAKSYDLTVISDEIYERLVYGVDHTSFASLKDMADRTIHLGGFSKSYAMTGWRCGWILGPESLISHGNSVQSHATSNVSSITQKAALAALTGGDSDVIAMCGEYKDRRDLLIDALKTEPRYRIVTPGGAFYLFPDITEFLSIDGLRTSAEFSTRLLQEAHVAVTPGEAFDAPGYLRLSFAASKTKLLEASERLLAFASKVN